MAELLTSESIESTSLALEGIDHIHSGNSLPLGVFGVGDGITDEILNTFAVVGEPEHVAPELKKRYGDVISRISFYAPYKSNPDRWSKVLADLKVAE